MKPGRRFRFRPAGRIGKSGRKIPFTSISKRRFMKRKAIFVRLMCRIRQTAWEYTAGGFLCPRHLRGAIRCFSWKVWRARSIYGSTDILWDFPREVFHRWSLRLHSICMRGKICFAVRCTAIVLRLFWKIRICGGWRGFSEASV